MCCKNLLGAVHGVHLLCMWTGCSVCIVICRKMGPGPIAYTYYARQFAGADKPSSMDVAKLDRPTSQGTRAAELACISTARAGQAPSADQQQLEISSDRPCPLALRPVTASHSACAVCLLGYSAACRRIPGTVQLVLLCHCQLSIWMC